MKIINLKYLLPFVCLFVLACNPDQDPLNPTPQNEYEELCNGFAGGNFNVSIDNSDWSTSCVEAAYTETVTDDYEQKLLYVYAYNYNGTFFSDTDIEVAWIAWFETTVNGQTTTDQVVAFYKGFYDYSRAISDPNYELEDLEVYTSDYENMDDVLTLSLDGNLVNGNINMTLYEEESNEEIKISGDFTANIDE